MHIEWIVDLYLMPTKWIFLTIWINKENVPSIFHPPKGYGRYCIAFIPISKKLHGCASVDRVHILTENNTLYVSLTLWRTVLSSKAIKMEANIHPIMFLSEKQIKNSISIRKKKF